jgi:hypothetical protein
MYRQILHELMKQISSRPFKGEDRDLISITYTRITFGIFS